MIPPFSEETIDSLFNIESIIQDALDHINSGAELAQDTKKQLEGMEQDIERFQNPKWRKQTRKFIIFLVNTCEILKEIELLFEGKSQRRSENIIGRFVELSQDSDINEAIGKLKEEAFRDLQEDEIALLRSVGIRWPDQELKKYAEQLLETPDEPADIGDISNIISQFREIVCEAAIKLEPIAHLLEPMEVEALILDVTGGLKDLCVVLIDITKGATIPDFSGYVILLAIKSTWSASRGLKYRINNIGEYLTEVLSRGDQNDHLASIEKHSRELNKRATATLNNKSINLQELQQAINTHESRLKPLLSDCIRQTINISDKELTKNIVEEKQLKDMDLDNLVSTYNRLADYDVIASERKDAITIIERTRQQLGSVILSISNLKKRKSELTRKLIRDNTKRR